MVGAEESGDSFTAESVRIAVGLIQGRVSMMGQKVDERSSSSRQSAREEMVFHNGDTRACTFMG